MQCRSIVAQKVMQVKRVCRIQVTISGGPRSHERTTLSGIRVARRHLSACCLFASLTCASPAATPQLCGAEHTGDRPPKKSSRVRIQRSMWMALSRCTQLCPQKFMAMTSPAISDEVPSEHFQKDLPHGTHAHDLSKSSSTTTSLGCGRRHQILHMQHKCGTYTLQTRPPGWRAASFQPSAPHSQIH